MDIIYIISVTAFVLDCKIKLKMVSSVERTVNIIRITF